MARKFYLATVLLLLCLYSTTRTAAQHTGSYDTTISFMSGTRPISIYVPTTYSPTTAYRLMICLHGLGDTCNNYRNGLITSLGWGTNIPNTIFLCPEAVTRNTDFFFPTGGEAIIQSCIDLARATYNIDTDNIVLQGFSLGGRAALRYGLLNYDKFKGLLLNTPAIQGVKEAVNGGPYTFNYANAVHIPIYITHGQTDLLYGPPIDSAFERMVLADGIVRYYDYPSMGHAIPAITSMNFLHFFDTPAHAGYDLDVVKASIPRRTCVTSLPASCLVRNTGASTIHTVKLNYTTASGTLTHTWTGTLTPFQHATIALPTITEPAGTNTLNVSVNMLETSITDTVASNNAKSAPFQVVTTGTPLPFFEGFETSTFPPTDWVLNPAGDAYSPLDYDNDVKRTGTGSMYAFNTILIFDNSTRSEGISSPVLDLSAAPAPHVSFDVAFNYHHYAPPVTLVDTVFADTLSLLVSTDCGDTYTEVYKKGGADLATFTSPILNPTTINADFIDPSDDEWRTEDIDLSAYAGVDKVIVKFNYKSSLGGSINIDNINFGSGAVGIAETNVQPLRIYPNPAGDVLNISAGNDNISAISITDIAGKTVLSKDGANTQGHMQLNTSGLTDGVYVIRVVSGSRVTTGKVVIKH